MPAMAGHSSVVEALGDRSTLSASLWTEYKHSSRSTGEKKSSSNHGNREIPGSGGVHSINKCVDLRGIYTYD